MDHARCPFEKAILSAHCHCRFSTRKVVAERLNAGCESPVAAARCEAVLVMLRERSRFALRLKDASAAIPFGKQMKVAIGGLMGLQAALGLASADSDRVADIHALLDAANETYGSPEQYPYQEIVKSVIKFELRKRRP